MQEKIRISKLLADRGICSRREADAYIERGLVLLDGNIVRELGTRATRDQRIELAPQAKARQQSRLTIILHKPIGVVSHEDPDRPYTPALRLITAENLWQPPHPREAKTGSGVEIRRLRGLAPAGRLDIDSTGLLVLTQDGTIARLLIGESSPIEKEYLVRVDGSLSAEGLRLLNHGLSLDGQALRPAKVSWQNKDQLRFILREGRKRQIRRMCELVGLKVTGLKRIRIGKIKLGSLPLGQWRALTPGERF